MTKQDNNSPKRTFSSPPCSMHEVDPAYMGLQETTDSAQRTDVQRWRTAERKRLIQNRLDLDPAVRRNYSAQVFTLLEHLVGDVEGLMFGVYWPIRGEPDIQPFSRTLQVRGGSCALPVVTSRDCPLVFRSWADGDPLVHGIWNIPAPTEDAEVVVPDVLIVPIVGFDYACHRLGHGGGYYDRTLGTMQHRPRVYGVGYTLGVIPTIYPQWHDIPMDAIVTERGVITSATDRTSN